MSTAPPIATATASARAYAFIRASILEGRFGPGMRLKEEELTKLCGLSRTPVREALRRLSIEGLVFATPHQGAQVARMSEAELSEIYALRAMLEAHAAGRAASRITEASIARLKALASEMEAVIAEGRSGDELNASFTPANSQFHQIIIDAADSPRLATMGSLVVETPLIFRTLARYSREELQRSMHHHRELIAAFETRDEDWARSVMRSHILAAAHAVVRQAEA
jgi:DNA-binding GntR family transcriptional regulator